MNHKECIKCHKVKNIDDFPIRSDTGKLMGKCKDCRKVYNREHYKNNKVKYRKSRNMYKESVAMEIRTLKESTPCADCGNSYPYYVMDFDHLPGFKKEYNIGDLFNNRFFSKTRVHKEIAKCEIVCSNCHRIRTYVRKNTP